MDKGLQEVIAKLNQQKPQVSQQISKPAEKPATTEEESLEDSSDDDFLEDTEQQKVEKIQSEEQKVAVEMELLQNNGRFRAELLFQLQELNKALSVIAQIMMRNK